MQKLGTIECDVQAGHPLLLKTLMEHRSALLKTAARITGCHSRAEDVVQDAFFRLTNVPKLTLSLKAQVSYVFRIVRNLAIDNYRKQMLEQRYSGSEEEGLNAAVHSATPEVESLNQETLELLDKALAQLPERTRYAFEMYRLHGKQQKDIARELGVSPTLVNFMIRNALIHCRQSVSMTG